MGGFTDIHCHILPLMDDGPEAAQESLAMARCAFAAGTRVLVATPHVTPGVYDNSLASIRQATEAFRGLLQEEGIDLDVRWAADVRLSPELIRLVAEGSLPTLNKTGSRRFFLLEFPHDTIPPGSDKIVRRLLEQNYVPVLTHPERHRVICHHPGKLLPFLEMGCLSQLTAGSLTGVFGMDARRCAVTLLEKDWAHVIASDAHDLRERSPDLREGVQAAAQVVGMSRAMAMVTSIPGALL
ncbi:MAG: capsular biosynthesis protein [Magnetococcales bacterium]|nr:capsular biosynthesis protein [Magnetococcales bacterium]MBF0322216.1 capsular biosynthesis protein [Magnetococcales bacterium]